MLSPWRTPTLCRISWISFSVFRTTTRSVYWYAWMQRTSGGRHVFLEYEGAGHDSRCRRPWRGQQRQRTMVSGDSCVRWLGVNHSQPLVHTREITL
jgi:hypothetical protein